MARGKFTVVSGETLELGAGTADSEGSLIVHVESLSGGTIEVHGRAAGSGIARVKIEGYEHDDSGTLLTSIGAAGLFKFPCGGLDVALVVAGGDAVLATQFVAG